MPSEPRRPLITVDIGNSRIKLGVFEPPLAEPLPHAARTLAVGLDWTEAELAPLVPRGPADFDWSIASVNRPAAERLVAWLASQGTGNVRELAHADLPLVVDVARPETVGLDRLANCVAANRIRDPHQGAIVIDMGSALTFNLLSAAGAFVGGAILPGIATSARALEAFTDALPLVEVNEPPPALGKSTVEAIRSGLYWGAVGAVRTIVAQLQQAEGSASAQIFLTGGAGPIFADVLGEVCKRPPRFVPHLTLAGIALATLSVQGRKGSA